jgi:hypothetical protein
MLSFKKSPNKKQSLGVLYPSLIKLGLVRTCCYNLILVNYFRTFTFSQKKCCVQEKCVSAMSSVRIICKSDLSNMSWVEFFDLIVSFFLCSLVDISLDTILYIIFCFSFCIKFFSVFHSIFSFRTSLYKIFCVDNLISYFVTS